LSPEGVLFQLTTIRVFCLFPSGDDAVTYETHSGGHELGGKERHIVRFLGALAAA
jgi:hypothetical protein